MKGFCFLFTLPVNSELLVHFGSTSCRVDKDQMIPLTDVYLFFCMQLPIVASSMVSLYFLELTDVVKPAQVGFRCHDRDLSMPYVDGGDELIPLLMLLSLAFAGPAASVP